MKKNEFWATTLKRGKGYFHHKRIFITRDEARRYCCVAKNFKVVKVRITEIKKKK